MRIHELNESRKFSDKNPKTSINQYIKDAILSAPGEIAGVINCFVSFTKIEKLGINPRSGYDTPLGIYSYLCQYVLDLIGDEDSTDRLPFAGSEPFANIFSVRGNIVNVSTMKEVDEQLWYEKIKDIWDSVKPATSYVLEDIIQDASTDAIHADLPGGRFWYVTTKTSEHFKNYWKTKKPVAWNKLFRVLGIDGVVDSAGIIHENEDTQGLFFSLDPIYNLRRVANLYSPEVVNMAVSAGEKKKQQINTFTHLLKNTPTDKIPKLVNDFLQRNPGIKVLNYIRDPHVRDTVLSAWPGMLRTISKPVRDDLVSALKGSDDAITFLAAPIPENDLVAILRQNPQCRINGALITKLYPSPSPALQVELVKRDPYGLLKVKKKDPAAVQLSVDALNRRGASVPDWLTT